MDDESWLNSWCRLRRLPGTFAVAMRYAMRHERRERASPETNRIAKPKMTWQETAAWLKGCGERQKLVVPKEIPVEYDDPKQQAAFEAVYKDRLYLLRVPEADDR